MNDVVKEKWEEYNGKLKDKSNNYKIRKKELNTKLKEVEEEITELKFKKESKLNVQKYLTKDSYLEIIKEEYLAKLGKESINSLLLGIFIFIFLLIINYIAMLNSPLSILVVIDLAIVILKSITPLKNLKKDYEKEKEQSFGTKLNEEYFAIQRKLQQKEKEKGKIKFYIKDLETKEQEVFLEKYKTELFLVNELLKDEDLDRILCYWVDSSINKNNNLTLKRRKEND